MATMFNLLAHLAAFVIFALIGSRNNHVVDGLSCAPCFNKTGAYVGPECEALPQDPEECEQTFKLCGCCPVCALEEGENCGAMTTRCRTGLCCVNEEGRAKEEVEWYDHAFHGICRSVDSCPRLI